MPAATIISRPKMVPRRTLSPCEGLYGGDRDNADQAPADELIPLQPEAVPGAPPQIGDELEDDREGGEDVRHPEQAHDPRAVERAGSDARRVLDGHSHDGPYRLKTTF